MHNLTMPYRCIILKICKSLRERSETILHQKDVTTGYRKGSKLLEGNKEQGE